MLGNNLRELPGVPQEFGGFNSMARYWRLVIVKNHGAPQTSFHGVEFFGYDNRVVKLIDQLNLNEYEDILFDNVKFK